MDTFQVHQLRVYCEAQTPIRLNEHKGSAIRGALFYALRGTAYPNAAWSGFCANKVAPNCFVCPVNAVCPVMRLVSTLDEEGTHGHQAPRPYIINPPLEEQTVYARGEHFGFDLLLAGDAADLFPYVVLALDRLAYEGLGAQVESGGWGSRRGTAHVTRIDAVHPLTGELSPVLRPSSRTVNVPALPITHADVLAAAGRLPTQGDLTLHFITPLRLVEREQLVQQPYFRPLLHRLIERIKRPHGKLRRRASALSNPRAARSGRWGGADREPYTLAGSKGLQHPPGAPAGDRRAGGSRHLSRRRLDAFFALAGLGHDLTHGQERGQGGRLVRDRGGRGARGIAGVPNPPGPLPYEGRGPGGRSGGSMSIIQHLVVEQFGRHVGKHQERLQVTDLKTSDTVIEAPLLHLEDVLIASRGISISADAIAACTERGIPINFLDGHGNPFASLYSAGLTGTVQTRRAQLQAFCDGRGRAVSAAFCIGKLRNQTNLLRYMAKYRKEAAPKAYEELRCLACEVLDHVTEIERLGGATADDIRFELLSAEGRGAQRYWEGIRLLLRETYDWPGRRTQGASDPINASLNYGYGILYGQVERAVVLAGLDPYAGFLHVDRSGKPSLVLDLIEEFRAATVDRAVLGLVNKGSALAQDDKGKLDSPTRKLLAEKVQERLDAPVRYAGKQNTLRSALQSQARHLAVFLARRAVGVRVVCGELVTSPPSPSPAHDLSPSPSPARGGVSAPPSLAGKGVGGLGFLAGG